LLFSELAYCGFVPVVKSERITGDPDRDRHPFVEMKSGMEGRMDGNVRSKTK
jgi:hypothetical protein